MPAFFGVVIGATTKAVPNSVLILHRISFPVLRIADSTSEESAEYSLHKPGDSWYKDTGSGCGADAGNPS